MPSFTPGEAVTHPAAHQPGHPHTAVPTGTEPQIRANPWRPLMPGATPGPGHRSEADDAQGPEGEAVDAERGQDAGLEAAQSTRMLPQSL